MIAPAIAAAALAAGYGLTLLRAPTSLRRSMFKTAPVALLAAASALGDGPALLTAGLALSAIGDAALSREGDGAFRLGLGAFLLAHIAYIPLFWNGAGGALYWVAAAVMAGYAAGAARWLWPHLGDMRPPVAVYMIAIAAMGVAALTASPLVMIGAILFVASDTVLAAETFVFKDAPRRWTPPVIWGAYAAAQILIYLGAVNA